MYMLRCCVTNVCYYVIFTEVIGTINNNYVDLNINGENWDDGKSIHLTLHIYRTLHLPGFKI